VILPPLVFPEEGIKNTPTLRLISKVFLSFRKII